MNYSEFALLQQNKTYLIIFVSALKYDNKATYKTSIKSCPTNYKLCEENTCLSI